MVIILTTRGGTKRDILSILSRANRFERAVSVPQIANVLSERRGEPVARQGLYPHIYDLVDYGFVEKIDDDDAAAKYYRLTETGDEVITEYAVQLGFDTGWHAKSKPAGGVTGP